MERKEQGSQNAAQRDSDQPGTRWMTGEEQAALVELARGGDVAARERLIQAHMRLVISIAHRMSKRGLPLDDLVSEGTIGLIQSIDRFDATRGVKFTTFAARTIQHTMQSAIGESIGVVRLPPKVRRLLAQWVRESHKFRVVNGRPADPGMIAKVMGLPVHLLLRVERSRLLQAGMVGDGDGDGVAQINGTMGSNASGTRDRGPEDSSREMVARLSTALEALDASQATAVRLHFGLSGAKPMSVREIAKAMSTTTPRAKRDLEMGLAALRRAIGSR